MRRNPRALFAPGGAARRWWRRVFPRTDGAASGLVEAAGTTLDWAALVNGDPRGWEAAREAALSGPRVLVATSLGGYSHAAALESSLSVALTLRGAQADVLLCDSFLPACQLTKFQLSPPEELFRLPVQPRCGACQATGQAVFEPLGLPIHWYSHFVTPEQRRAARDTASALPLEEISDYRPDGLAVGEHARAGVLRYYGRGDLEGEPAGEGMLRRYLEASLLSVHAIRGLLRQHRYDAACFHHGIYVPQGLLGEVCRQEGVRVVNWNPAYRKHCFIFSHGDTYHHTMIRESVDSWQDVPWNAEREAETMAYLKSRWYGTQDWIWFHEKPEEDLDRIAREIGIDFSRPLVGMLTNVLWDAQLHYASNAFTGMLEWVFETIRYFAARPEVQLVIRVHPAEVRGMVPSRQPLVPEIARVFPALPLNVFVIPPESQVSTYAVMERCDSVLIYNTKTGIEVSSMGIPVVVAGEAWVRGKGFSLDASSPEEYFRILDRLPLGSSLDAAERERARKYAYHFFFRRMIPLPFVHMADGAECRLELGSLRELAPGVFPGLDIICDGILKGDPFIYPAERLGWEGANADGRAAKTDRLAV